MALLRFLTRQFKASTFASPTVAHVPRFAVITSAPSSSSLLISALAIRATTFFPQLQFRAMGYKLKTKTSVKKRFKVNKNGLVKRSQANKRHIATKKTRERIRRLGKPVFVQGKIRKNILRMLGRK